MPAARVLNKLFSRAGLLLVFLSAAAAAWGDVALHDGFDNLPGTTISLTSTEENGVLSAEVISILPYTFALTASSLVRTENWCEFMPLHFNIKACTYERRDESELLTLYSGRKNYQTPGDSHILSYRIEKREQGDRQLALLLRADSGPAGTRDYRIEINATQAKEGTRLHIRSSYRPSMTSSLLTRTYLSTLGRDKVGFTHIEQDGVLRPVQGVRGVIERNIMRYHMAIDAFLSTQSLSDASQREAMLTRWFKQNESYPQQLHEMTEKEYLEIKQRERENQQQLQRSLDEKQRQVAMR